MSFATIRLYHREGKVKGERCHGTRREIGTAHCPSSILRLSATRHRSVARSTPTLHFVLRARRSWKLESWTSHTTLPPAPGAHSMEKQSNYSSRAGFSRT